MPRKALRAQLREGERRIVLLDTIRECLEADTEEYRKYKDGIIPDLELKAKDIRAIIDRDLRKANEDAVAQIGFLVGNGIPYMMALNQLKSSLHSVSCSRF